MKLLLAICIIAATITTSATANSNLSYKQEQPVMQRKWVTVPTHVNNPSSGRPYLIRAYLHPDQVCGAMQTPADSQECYDYWQRLPVEAFPLQKDETEAYADTEQTMRIRITEEVFCAMVRDEQQRTSLRPQARCPELWQEFTKK